MKKSFSLIIILSLFLIVGCAGQTTIKPEAEFKIKNIKTASVKVKTLLADCKEEIEKIEKTLIEKLKEANMFDAIHENTQNTDLIIEIDIEELAKVTKSDRFWYGAMAGRAKVGGKVKLIEGFSGKVLGSFYVESLSSGGTVFAGTTQQAIDDFVNEVVKHLIESTVQ
ncbi:DUF4410 domain-containing protein [Thermodesulfovibrio yellowstonii]|uniref:DUF4410 domain-containing protein n=1 Tax=Thermodesulfovibrio yellowstonii TaxID=28262 RepID=A0A9W6GFB1_9BACT|nr:DUF4410 domain-containing protein [Thermodesulfovibrio islandicus]GLI52889.1 hypothetical protein TISLANDTSLP1_05820 [Thermodesulfovibrio islandicus]